MLHNQHIRTSKLPKESWFRFLSSNRVMTKPGDVERKIQRLSQMTLSPLRGGNFLRTAIERESGVPGLHVDYSAKVVLGQ